MGGCSRSADITPPPPQTPIPRQRGDRQHKGSDRPQQRHQQLCVHVKVSFSKVARSPGGGIKTESQRRYFEKFKPSVTQNTLSVKMEGVGGGVIDGNELCALADVRTGSEFCVSISDFQQTDRLLFTSGTPTAKYTM